MYLCFRFHYSRGWIKKDIAVICVSVLPMLSSRSFTVSHLIFRSLNHSEFICICMEVLIVLGPGICETWCVPSKESLLLSALLCSHTQDLPAFNAKCSEGSSSECLTRRLSWSAVFMWECPCVACVGLISFAGEVRVLSCARLLRPHGLYSLAASSVHGTFQARILTWVAISFSRGSSGPRAQTWVSCVAGRFFTISHFCWWKWSLSVMSESLWPHWL